ncbi:hypothetical protein Z946_3750 [Sulfitobacter noctilucicola]|nr:hypothetical protein Z946_3750 [Sulfitobacter noctilucicola]
MILGTSAGLSKPDRISGRALLTRQKASLIVQMGYHTA